MTMVLNNAAQRLKIKGVSIGPREMADVNLSGKELGNHLFVRSGLLEVSKGAASSGGGKRKQSAESSGEDSKTEE